jgi:hypothetical protein
MIATGIEQEDIKTLSEILESEKKLHQRKCMMCLIMFAVAFVALVIALVVLGVQLALIMNASGVGEISGQFAWFQVLAPLAGAAMLFFSSWWAAQNCLNAIERTLCAARNQRMKLFETFLGQIKCADKDKQAAWLEIVKGVVM